MTKNTVLESTKPLIESPQYVFINKERLEDVAKRWSQEDLQVPSWEEPVFLGGAFVDMVDSFMLGNAINFAYVDFNTKQRFSTLYKGVEWKGAFGMWACLKRAFEAGIPIMDGTYLRDISRADAEKIFEGNIRIPLFEERLNIFRELGKVLCEEYDCQFHNVLLQSNKLLFNDGGGFVERLVCDFPSFNDSVNYNGSVVRFDKRAQLVAGMIYGRLNKRGINAFEDVDELTVFADYGLPKSLRDLEILSYESSLADRVDQHVIIPANSQEELEIRASTIHASKMLTNKINEVLCGKEINALHIDYKLWSESRNKKGNHHLTITTAY